MNQHRCLHFEKKPADLWQRTRAVLRYNVYWGRHVGSVPHGSVIFFPCHNALFRCGLAGIVAVKHVEKTPAEFNMQARGAWNQAVRKAVANLERLGS